MAVVVSDEEGGSRRSTDEQEGGRTRTPLPTATATTMTADDGEEAKEDTAFSLLVSSAAAQPSPASRVHCPSPCLRVCGPQAVRCVDARTHTLAYASTALL